MATAEKVAQAMDEEGSRWDIRPTETAWEVIRHEKARATVQDDGGAVEVKFSGSRPDAFAFIEKHKRLAIATAAMAKR